MGLFRKGAKIPASEFDSLAQAASDHLMKWKTHVVECSFNYPMPSLQAVQAIERGTFRMSDELINNIRMLDERLELGGKLFETFIELEGLIHGFKSAPDGPGFQRLGGAIDKADVQLTDLRRKRTAGG